MLSRLRLAGSGVSRSTWRRGYQSGAAGVYGHNPGALERLRSVRLPAAVFLPRNIIILNLILTKSTFADGRARPAWWWTTTRATPAPTSTGWSRRSGAAGTSTPGRTRSPWRIRRRKWVEFCILFSKVAHPYRMCANAN